MFRRGFGGLGEEGGAGRLPIDPWENSRSMARVLVIDDDVDVCGLLCQMVSSMGHEPSEAASLAEGLERARTGGFEVVLLDVRLPDGNGLVALPEFLHVASEPEVIIITGDGDPDGAELAIKSGAWDYIEKPHTYNMVRLPLLRALKFREQKKAKAFQVATKEGVRALKREGIIGRSPRMKACLDLMAQASAWDTSVLLSGETGTGKDLFARAVHDNSDRAGGPFVVVDCAALTETLIESVLFGYKKGAFTGADKTHEGMIKQADGGTIFLDEVGEMPLSIQKSFLRVLQERRFRPVGGKSEETSDFRLIAATNRNLDEMVREKQFRQDLFFRIAAMEVVLPPLRERVEDVKEIALHHMARLCDRYDIGTKGFSPEFLSTLYAYAWPGNVRELVHALETAILTAQEEPVLYPYHLPVHIRAKAVRAFVRQKDSAPPPLPSANGTNGELPTLHDYRESAVNRLEKQYLTQLMERHASSIRDACRISGLSRPHLYSLMKKHGIRREH